MAISFDCSFVNIISGLAPESMREWVVQTTSAHYATTNHALEALAALSCRLHAEIHGPILHSAVDLTILTQLERIQNLIQQRAQEQIGEAQAIGSARTLCCSSCSPPAPLVEPARTLPQDAFFAICALCLPHNTPLTTFALVCREWRAYTYQLVVKITGTIMRSSPLCELLARFGCVYPSSDSRTLLLSDLLAFKKNLCRLIYVLESTFHPSIRAELNAHVEETVCDAALLQRVLRLAVDRDLVLLFDPILRRSARRPSDRSTTPPSSVSECTQRAASIRLALSDSVHQRFFGRHVYQLTHIASSPETTLTSIPGEIALCPNLEALQLPNNSIFSIPPEIGNCENIRLVVLSNNRLIAVSETIGQCQKLHTLLLDHNFLYQLPEDLSQRLTLSELDISNNRFPCDKDPEHTVPPKPLSLSLVE